MCYRCSIYKQLLEVAQSRQLSPPYFHNLTSLIHSPSKAFGKVSQWLWEGAPMALGRFPNGFGRVPQRLWGVFPMALGNHAFKQQRFAWQAAELLLIKIISKL